MPPSLHASPAEACESAAHMPPPPPCRRRRAGSAALAGGVTIARRCSSKPTAKSIQRVGQAASARPARIPAGPRAHCAPGSAYRHPSAENGLMTRLEWNQHAARGRPMRGERGARCFYVRRAWRTNDTAFHIHRQGAQANWASLGTCNRAAEPPWAALPTPRVARRSCASGCASPHSFSTCKHKQLPPAGKLLRGGRGAGRTLRSPSSLLQRAGIAGAS